MLVVLALLAGCGNDVSIARDPESISAQERLGLTDAQVGAILDLLNDCGTTFAVLDDQAALDADAADALVSRRDGPDGACGTEDDRPFATLNEVDATPQVGDATILAVLAFVENGGADGGGVWEDVAFSADEAAVALQIANDATRAALDDDVGLAADEAANIVDARPIATMDALAAVPEVGTSALEKIKAYVPSWEGGGG